ncbi:UVR domain-containing protein [Haematococcus lacustris]|uniref:UVR domain-containing protein n=1 Tax=Haematococcus lacustris TaxID=44745 RepID=A0A6A0A789_HAELA|nr:UVR domain-containing protein [Haematococcus lacustris]
MEARLLPKLTPVLPGDKNAIEVCALLHPFTFEQLSLPACKKHKVKAELATVEKADAVTDSFARVNFHPECEAAVNEQINIEYAVSYVYHALYSYFDRDNVALRGFAKYFKVTEQDIANIVAQWTGIPVEKVSSDETERLIKMEEVLHGRVIGQEEAVSAISRAIRRARVGLKSPSRPIASFIFAGPTGVGKSELAKTLANYYFGSEEAMVRLDMSEFMERHTVSKLIGSPPGYVGYSEGGQLTEAVRRRPYTVVLFDEIEKAHPDVFNMMLQILEDGRLTDSKGRTVDFKNTLIIMTSNSLVGEELKSYFRPEFLNRLDEIIVFRQLTKKEVKQIADIFLKDVFKRAQEKGIKIEVTDKFKDRLVDEGFNPTYGARPLRRAIMRLIEDCLAERILTGDIKDGDVVIMDVDPDGSIAVLAGDKKMRTAIDATPAGIA